MISRYEVKLNGQNLSEINENLLILNVGYERPEFQKTIFAPANRETQIIQRRRKGQARVIVSFELHLYDIAERQAVYQQVVSWCRNGGVLQTNDRPEMRLNVVCDEFPAIESVRDWTQEMQVTFAAYAYPYWEDADETVSTLTGSNARGSMLVPGNIGETLANISVTANDAISHLSVSIGGNTITLSGISIPRGGVVQFGHDNNALLFIRNGSTSLLNKRTSASSDDLTAQCGANNSIAVTASASVTAQFSVRGCWL